MSFIGANLQGANFSKQDHQGKKFISANLKGADFNETNLQKAKFNGANLQNANFKGADLRNAKFVGTDLQNADLRNADIRGATFTGANLDGAKLGGAKQDQSTKLVGARLNGVDWSEEVSAKTVNKAEKTETQQHDVKPLHQDPKNEEKQQPEPVTNLNQSIAPGKSPISTMKKWTLATILFFLSTIGAIIVEDIYDASAKKSDTKDQNLDKVLNYASEKNLDLSNAQVIRNKENGKFKMMVIKNNGKTIILRYNEELNKTTAVPTSEEVLKLLLEEK